MRYNLYKQVIECTLSIRETVAYILTSRNYILYQDCLAKMNVIAEAIEKEDTPGAIKIKNTLNAMYLQFQESDTKVKADADVDATALLALSKKLVTQCRKDLSYKISILFVAELASKWDAMESVYKAFKKRDDCEVEVVLEPVFRAARLASGETESETIYDDWLTPLGIKHIPYKEYNFDEKRPDITFITQPYESETIPEFWPENIARYSRLVYIPFNTVLKLVSTTDYHNAFKLPILNHAWRIVCQSDRMKEYYRRYAPQNANKVIVTGLPKWDYAMVHDRGNTPCPEEWKEKIAGKKVFLYSTHYTDQFATMSSENRGVINFFLGRTDCALIWRPHPMTESVNKQYNPENYARYKANETAALKSSNVIIDRDPSYANAFVWSDILISGENSLLAQYLLARKPIILRTPDLQANDISGLFEFLKLPFFYNRESLSQIVSLFIADPEANKKNREQLLEKFFSHANGHVGHVVCDTMMRMFYREEGTV